MAKIKKEICSFCGLEIDNPHTSCERLKNTMKCATCGNPILNLDFTKIKFNPVIRDNEIIYYCSFGCKGKEE